ncbi:pirin family protein [Xanthocytophaga flava]|uniref:pirin family protein n=1 Tax=Xanthocytophaga flava TaxID=3048013 RepID=UPI0028D50291|nr:pirin [Xanthocytophaga flavus]MDJ1467062.1 pirin [Xanthocytophaga flavus]
MIVQNKAVIHLAEQRGFLSSEGQKSYVTFNFGEYQNEHRKPFGVLQLWNEEILSAEKSIELTVPQSVDVVLVPLAGLIEYKDSNGTENFISAGQIYVTSLSEGTSYQLINPFEKDEIVICLHMWLTKLTKTTDIAEPTEQITFNLDETNQLLPLIAVTTKPYQCYIGKYDGRVKGEYTLTNNRNGIYVFVITGAFEVQDRLLHAKDALALWETESIDFEALSEGAILLLFEVSGEFPA